ncbi:MAG: hypothetical protein JST00_18470 [Deltaproteobacteria bacterium]|nr:hypothetical protein [Deltaproteobacteria bacterium]
MQWLKGLVAPAAEFAGQQLQQGAPQAQPGGPPIGGASPYGVQPPGAGPSLDPSAGAVAPQGGGFDASQMQWSTGTKTQGGGGKAAASPFATTIPQTPSAIATATAAQASPVPQTSSAPQSLEARCAQLQHDVESLALFARTLLTMLEEAKIVTREQFETTKNRLDLLDGKLDDR